MRWFKSNVSFIFIHSFCLGSSQINSTLVTLPCNDFVTSTPPWSAIQYLFDLSTSIEILKKKCVQAKSSNFVSAQRAMLHVHTIWIVFERSKACKNKLHAINTSRNNYGTCDKKKIPMHCTVWSSSCVICLQDVWFCSVSGQYNCWWYCVHIASVLCKNRLESYLLMWQWFCSHCVYCEPVFIAVDMPALAEAVFLELPGLAWDMSLPHSVSPLWSRLSGMALDHHTKGVGTRTGCVL